MLGTRANSCLFLCACFIFGCSQKGSSDENQRCEIGERPQGLETVVFAGPTTPEEFDRYWVEYKSLGGDNKDWDVMSDHVANGECVYFFRSPDKDWEQLNGISGFALVMDKKISKIALYMIN